MICFLEKVKSNTALKLVVCIKTVKAHTNRSFNLIY